MAFPSDLEIAQRATLQPITAIGEKLGIDPERMENYGRYKAKLPLDLIDEDKVKKSKPILMTAIRPPLRARQDSLPASGCAKG